MEFLTNVPSYILLTLGFGFVIFWHELGHFLAAKWAGVKVEQFAIGFGTAIFSWRKGLGFTWGSSAAKLEQIQSTQRDGASAIDPQSIGETEYRLNWLPLGGYVKMLGQDDLNPNATVNDPRAYNMRPIGKRMVIVSAGVIMNVILAAIGFFALFMIGYDAPASVVGRILPGSPAQRAGVQVGDEVLRLGGTRLHDFTKIQLNVALMGDGETVPLEVVHPNGEKATLQIRAERPGDARGFLALGISPSPTLQGIDPRALKDSELDPALYGREILQIKPGEVIVEVAGAPITDPTREFYKLDRALQQSGGKPVAVKVKQADGAMRQELLKPSFVPPFGERTPLDFAGMVPRTLISQVMPDSPVKGKILPGDIVASVKVGTDVWDNPTRIKLSDMLNDAGLAGNPVDITVIRDGKSISIDSAVPNVKLKDKKRVGLNVAIAAAEEEAVIGGVERESAADRVGIPRGATIVSINGEPIGTWHDVRRVIASLAPGKPVQLAFKPSGSDEIRTKEMMPSEAEIARVKSYRYETGVALRDRMFRRHTTNPLEAAAWGVGETRDMIVQFYITLKRIFQRSVSATNLMGPVGIARAGGMFAVQGMDKLIWFLAMISANLAVVNFLPIPIVDGGLFLFLIIEKIQGRPLSPRMQSIAQMVGLALIASVVIFVTYQDIVR